MCALKSILKKSILNEVFSKYFQLRKKYFKYVFQMQVFQILPSSADSMGLSSCKF